MRTYAKTRPIRVILTHDIDWPPQGPGINHILARKDRFDQEIVSKVIKEGYNPYFGIPELMNIEREYGVRSTFFFRSKYDDGSSIEAYENVLRSLINGGWEIGIHINDASELNSIMHEKNSIEKVIGLEVYGSRVHNLNIKFDNLPLLYQAGLKYDSSIVFNKHDIDVRNSGFIMVGELVVFPITIMDSYLFTYMKISEERIMDIINKAIEIGAEKGFITILWHDCSIKMKGGRMYSKILELMVSKDYLEIIRGIDAYRIIVRRGK